MRPESTIGLAIGLQIGPLQNATLFENDVLDHAAVPFRHNEHVERTAVLFPFHQLIVDSVHDLSARESWRDMKRRNGLGDFQYPSAIPAASAARELSVGLIDQIWWRHFH